MTCWTDFEGKACELWSSSCANRRSWTTALTGLPTPSDSFAVATFFFHWEAGDKAADTCCLAGERVLESAKLYPKFVCFLSRYCHKSQWPYQAHWEQPLRSCSYRCYDLGFEVSTFSLHSNPRIRKHCLSQEPQGFNWANCHLFDSLTPEVLLDIIRILVL